MDRHCGVFARLLADEIELAENEQKFVKITLNTACYIDQYEAIDVLERLVTDDDIDTTTDALGRTVDLTEFFFRAVADLETEEPLGPRAPPYWDEDDDLPSVINIDRDIEQRIRDLAHHRLRQSRGRRRWPDTGQPVQRRSYLSSRHRVRPDR